MTDVLTSCPICSGPLTAGRLYSRGGNYFLPDGEKQPITYAKSSIEQRNGVKLPPNMLGGENFPACRLCRNCHMIFLPYE